MLSRLLVIFALVSMLMPSVVMGHGVTRDHDKHHDNFDGDLTAHLDQHRIDYDNLHEGYEDYKVHHSHSTTSNDGGDPILTTDNWHWHRSAEDSASDHDVMGEVIDPTISGTENINAHGTNEGHEDSDGGVLVETCS